MRSRGLLYCVLQEETSICTELADSMVTLGEPRDGEEKEWFELLDTSSSSKHSGFALGQFRWDPR